MIEVATTFAIYASWTTSLAFVVGYAISAPFWKTWVGRALFALGCDIFAVASLAVVAQLFGQDYSLRPVARLLVWGSTAVIAATLCMALYRAQVRSRRGRQVRSRDTSERQ